MREWLNSQAAAGYVIYHPTSATYELTPEQSLVLAEDDSPVFMPPAWEVPVSMFFDEEKTMNAFRTGIGVAWDEHNDRLFCGVAAFYRNAYRNNLVREWLPALRGVEEKAACGRQSRGCQLRPRPFHHSHGRGVPNVALLGLRLSR